MKRFRLADCVFSILCFAYQFDVWLGDEQRANPFTNDGVIINH